VGRQNGETPPLEDRRTQHYVVDYAGTVRQTWKTRVVYEPISGTESGVAMTDSVPPQDAAADDPTIAGDASRPDLGLVQPSVPSLDSDEHAHESPPPRVDDVDPDDPGFTLLAW
jgi:hypothetical protein